MTKGKLFGSKTYLVGAMDRAPDGGVEWRERITPRLHELGIMVYNPCYKPIHDPKVLENEDTRAEIDRLRLEGKFEELRERFGSVRTVDLRMVDTSDFLICNVDTAIHACGTYEETTTANRQKKPVLVHCEQGKTQVPNWMLMKLPHWCFFDTWDSMLDYLSDINAGAECDDRWVFFDLDKEINAINSYVTQ